MPCPSGGSREWATLVADGMAGSHSHGRSSLALDAPLEPAGNSPPPGMHFPIPSRASARPFHAGAVDAGKAVVKLSPRADRDIVGAGVGRGDESGGDEGARGEDWGGVGIDGVIAHLELANRLGLMRCLILAFARQRPPATRSSAIPTASKTDTVRIMTLTTTAAWPSGTRAIILAVIGSLHQSGAGAVAEGRGLR